MKIAGLVLIVEGVLALVYRGITYTSNDTLVDIGPLHATAEREHTLPIAPIAGAAAVGVGVLLLVISRKK